MRTARGDKRRDDPKNADGLPRSRLPSFVAAIAGTAALLMPTIGQSRDLVVYGEPTLEKALKSVGTLWQARTGTRINVFVAPTELSLAQIERGARCDVIFALSGAAIDAAAARKIIHADTVSPMARNGLTLVGIEPHSGAVDGATVAELSSLVAGKKLAIASPDRDVAGARSVDVLRKIGYDVEAGNKQLLVAESSAGVVSFLETNKARLGIVLATDAADFKFAVPLLAWDQPPIEYVVAQSRSPALDTRPFLAFLKSAEVKAVLKSAGLTPIGD